MGEHGASIVQTAGEAGDPARWKLSGWKLSATLDGPRAPLPATQPWRSLLTCTVTLPSSWLSGSDLRAKKS